MPERRKNPARKRSSGIKYLVALDAEGRTWRITRDGIATGGFARDKSTAIGLATHDAGREAAEGGQATVWSIQDGQRTKEWP